MRLDLLAKMSDTQHHAAGAVAVQQLELAVDERPPGHVHERLGTVRGEGAQARGFAAGEDGYGDVRHCDEDAV